MGECFGNNSVSLQLKVTYIYVSDDIFRDFSLFVVIPPIPVLLDCRNISMQTPVIFKACSVHKIQQDTHAIAMLLPSMKTGLCNSAISEINILTLLMHETFGMNIVNLCIMYNLYSVIQHISLFIIQSISVLLQK